MDREISKAWIYASFPTQFQWGHDFSAMDREISKAWIYASFPTQFQWGHDFSAMDRAEMKDQQGVDIAQVSMGPRLFSHG